MNGQTPQTGPDWGFGAYLHWPFCARICPYCDFNVYAAKARDNAPLVNAMCRDIQGHRAVLPDHPPLDTVYFGGGTPSLMSPETIVEKTTWSNSKKSMGHGHS